MKTDLKPTGFVRLDPCRYGTSRVPFRGPRRPVDGRYFAFLGGSDTFAKYVKTPYPQQVENALGEVCVNLGCQAAGPDVFLKDPAVAAICHDAVACVIAVMSAANLSNAYYRVHPRRNDRFIAPSAKLRALYPEVDFAEIAFTGHLIRRLLATDADRFEVVRTHLQDTWVRRMKALVAACEGPVVLLCFASQAPERGDTWTDGAHHAHFVSAKMIKALRPRVDKVVTVTTPRGDTEGMSFPPLEGLAAADMMGVKAHRLAAKALTRPLIRATQ